MSIINDLSRPTKNNSFNIKKKFKPNEICSALKVSMTYMVADAFNLTNEEIIWFGYQVGEALAPFSQEKPRSLPNVVTHELMTHQYSNLLAKRKEGAYVKSEDIQESNNEVVIWIDVMMEMIDISYSPGLFVQAETRAKLMASLKELGVGHIKNPRAALYLPNAIRHNAAQRSNA